MTSELTSSEDADRQPLDADEALIDLLRTLFTTAAALTDVVDAAAGQLGAFDDASPLIDAAVLVADARRDLAKIEATLSTAAGHRFGKRVGDLVDGRQYALKRGSDRTAWDHEGWQHDVRRAVVDQQLAEASASPVIAAVGADGEVTDFPLGELLHRATAAVQAVHGSTAPRTTALKRLDLYAGDYSDSTPGPWTISAVAPKPTTG